MVNAIKESFFSPKDGLLLGSLFFSAYRCFSDDTFHTVQYSLNKDEKGACECGVETLVDDMVEVNNLLAMKDQWAPCLLNARLRSPTYPQFRTLTDLAPILEDVRKIEKFLEEEEPTFEEFLQTVHLMIKVSTLSHGLRTLGVVTFGSRFYAASSTSLRLTQMALGKFKDETLDFIGASSEPTGPSTFMLMDVVSPLSHYDDAIRMKSPRKHRLDEAKFNQIVERFVRIYLTEAIFLEHRLADLVVAESSFSRGCLVEANASLLKIAKELKLRMEEIYTTGSVDSEQLVLFSTLVKMRTDSETGSDGSKAYDSQVFKTFDDVRFKVFSKAEETFLAIEK